MWEGGRKKEKGGKGQYVPSAVRGSYANAQWQTISSSLLFPRLWRWMLCEVDQLTT